MRPLVIPILRVVALTGITIALLRADGVWAWALLGFGLVSGLALLVRDLNDYRKGVKNR